MAENAEIWKSFAWKVWTLECIELHCWNTWKLKNEKLAELEAELYNQNS